jgi:hypothetical protein
LRFRSAPAACGEGRRALQCLACPVDRADLTLPAMKRRNGLYVRVLKLRKHIQEAEKAARQLASRIPPKDLREVLARLRACRDAIEKLLAGLPNA